MNQSLNVSDVVDVIREGMRYAPELTESLFRVFDNDEPSWLGGASPDLEQAERLSSRIRDVSTHDLQLIVGSAQRYDEIVVAAGERLGADVKASLSVEQNELAILAKLVDDVREQLGPEEWSKFLEELESDAGGDFPLAAAGTVTVQALLKMGGFTTYKLAVTLANFLARQLLGKGLTLAANAALTRYLSVFLGPVAISLSSAWLVYELMGPGYRKMIPAVVHIAAIRLALKNSAALVVVGQDLAGKDSLVEGAFGLDLTYPIERDRGTDGVRSFHLNGAAASFNLVRLLDEWDEAGSSVPTSVISARAFVIVIDALRVGHSSAKQTIERVRTAARPFLVVVNKLDLLDGDRSASLEAEAAELLEVDPAQVVACALRPDRRLMDKPWGVSKVRDAIALMASDSGVDASVQPSTLV